MIFVVVLTIVLTAVVVVTAWSAVKDVPADEAEEGPAHRAAPELPETLEGVLAGQLLAGEITAEQYRRAVQGLAERDADRHPLSVPPED